MIRFQTLAALLLAQLMALLPHPAAAQMDGPTLEALRGVDRRLATIAYRLTTANRDLCRDLQPVPGWAIHAVDQYDGRTAAAARQAFGFAAPVAVEALVAGGPAARAGVMENDALVAVAGTPLAATAGPAQGSATRDAAAARIAAQPAAAPLIVTVLRDGVPRTLTIPASPGCRSGFEILLGPKLEASSDGHIVQIGVRFFERYPDDQIAAVVAHELSHTLLRHRARLEAAGVKWGLFAELGRNGRLFRRTEDEADRLSVALLRNAGYDPRVAARFWRDHGGEVDGGLFRSRTHPSSAARAAAIDAEIASIPAGAAQVWIPPLLATRDQPLD